MIQIQISNKKHGGGGEYVGRPTPLGNPYVLHNEEERDQVIARYAAWLEDRLKQGDVRVRAELNRLYQKALNERGLELTCWFSALKHLAPLAGGFSAGSKTISNG